MKRLARASLALAAVSFACFIVMILAQVSYRYVGVSMVFSEEAARLFNVYAVFFGLVYVVYASGDVRINLIDAFFDSRPRLAVALSLVYTVLAIIFMAILCVGSWRLMNSNWSWPLPSISFLSKGHVYLAPFIGSVLSLIILVGRVIETLRLRQPVFPLTEDVE
ncbi:TRAP transporter small permease [Acuticoccus sediminis]|nr:TRAP transporter small permease subunit [Acuticoccus sediminis]